MQDSHKYIGDYIRQINTRFKSDISREHAYRADLEKLLRQLTSGVEITNEPANVTDCGNPDYVITKGKIPVGFIEAKDLGKDLNSKVFKEQFDRYRKALDNLMITDYCCFKFYQNGALVHEINIGKIAAPIDGIRQVKALTENFAEFTTLIQNFVEYVSQTIKSSKKLAEMMASKAKLLEVILEKALTSDEQTQDNSALKQQYQTFKKILIHDLTPSGFADIYAQTLAYGMFAARLHDPTLETFSRQEAAELIPKSNPFLRKLFSHVGGVDIDDRIKTTVDNLADVFRATNIRELLKNFGKATQTQDPIIHFYETFLAEYNPKLRKARGVWYTPEPVVNFIVRGVDEILKTEFNLKDGIADTQKTTIKVAAQGTAVSKGSHKGKTLFETKEVHKVQVLDPATGTGTFLAEVVKFIYKQKFQTMQGAWNGYVEQHLIPRLNGFELLMASYSMAHLKLELLLRETGYQTKNNQRFNIFLTNSLEQHHPDTGTLFSAWLSTEASEANKIKRDTPVMVVMGNPPYSVSSTNKNPWIENLITDYKNNLNEKSYNSLSDDYVKFIRYGQYCVDKNGSGVLAYISNNSFLDGIVHRQMRKNLLKSFDKIYILDLHGNAKKKEVCSDGSPDQNVFDIMQGVSINIFVKTGKEEANELGKIFHCDLFGKRDYKYKVLNENSIKTLELLELPNVEPNYYFAPKDFKSEQDYKNGFLLTSLMSNLNPGVESGRDDFFIDFNKPMLEQKISKVFNDKNSDELKLRYGIKDTSSFKFKSNLDSSVYDSSLIEKISYRPFDIRYTYYDRKLQRRASYDTFKHIIKGSLGLVIKRGFDEVNSAPVYVVNLISDRRGWTRAGMQGAESIIPIYLYSEGAERTPNLNQEIVNEIAKKLGLEFTNEKENTEPVKYFAPIDILDYIYAVLHSPTYREKYQEFLKIDFPKIPYPKNKNTFWKLVKLGEKLRQIHLLESPEVENYITQYPHSGDDTITRKITKNDWEITNKAVNKADNQNTKPENKIGRIWINDQQCFNNIPQTAWQFYIGGYQPAQKWLKDRKGRKLLFEDILHYQKIIAALNQTHKIMQEIDKIEFE